jgi:hypothetical protein
MLASVAGHASIMDTGATDCGEYCQAAGVIAPPSDVGCAMKTSAMSAMGKFLRLSYQTALMDTEEAIGLVVFGALICVFILLVAVVL